MLVILKGSENAYRVVVKRKRRKIFKVIRVDYINNAYQFVNSFMLIALVFI